MNVLGSPDEYEAFIVDSISQETVGVLPWNNIQWQRMRNGVSRAKVTCRRQQGTRPKWRDIAQPTAWGNLLVVTRNGYRVWDGPVLGWSSGNTLTVDAVDRSIMLSRRYVAADIELDPNVGGPFDMWTGVLNPMITASGLLTAGAGAMPFVITLAPLLVDTGSGLGFSIWVEGAWRFANLLTLQAVFDDLAVSGFLGWSQLNEKLSMFISNLADNYTLTLRPEHIISDTGDIGVTVRADSLVTGMYRGGNGQGIAGFPNPYLGENNQTYVPYGIYGVLPDANIGNTVFVNEAIQRVDPQQYLNPAPVPTLEAVTLNSTFPCSDDLTNLLPGAIWHLDFPDSWNLNTPVLTVIPDTDLLQRIYAPTIKYARLEQIDFQVDRTETAMTEKVEVSLSAFATEAGPLP
jgi:hypothetical protein